VRLWVTRTEPGAQRTASRLRALGHDAIVAPVLAYRAIPGAALDLTDAQALAFTSRNAVRIFADLSERRDLKAFVVGQGTADAAQALGFVDVLSADGDATDLVGLIAQTGPGAVVWPGPSEPAADLAAALVGKVEVRFQPIYETYDTQAPVPGGIDGVLVHSPKGAAAVARRLDATAAASLALYAISSAAAAPLAHLPFIRVSVAPLPNETALVNLIEG